MADIFGKIIDEIIEERLRQNKKWGNHRQLDNRTWLTILVEEVGEVAHADLEHDQEDLIKELVQCAAVTIAWLENRMKEIKHD